MVKRLFLILILLSSPALVQGQSQPVSAFVDRNEIALNEVITLTVRVDQKLGNDQPSFETLNQNFERLSTSQTNTYSNNNGNVNAWNEYKVSLRPKTTGRLSIPAFRIGAQVTTPITITVSEPTSNTASANNEIFLDTSVSKTDIYVQEQLLYTVKLFYTIGFNQGAVLTTPQVDNAVVQQLGSDDTYQELVDGVRYNVTERKFVIFPQSSGELTIPSLYFTATVGRGSRLNQIIASRNSATRQINLVSEDYEINVMPTPADFPGQTWLPASSITLEENWSAPLDSITAGESITRNILISASGLSSSLLPSFEYDNVDSLKFYPDQPEREDSANQSGVIGKRLEGTAIVPSEAGEFTLPAIEIPWWNTVTNQLEIARIAARTLTVKANANIQSNIAPPTQTQDSFDPTQQLSSQEQKSVSNQLWIIATVLFASAWIISTLLWLRNRRGNPAISTPAPSESSFDEEGLPDLQTAYKVLQRAHEQGNLLDLKRCLISWGQAYFQNRHILTLDNFDQQIKNPKLSRILSKFEQALYSEKAETKEFNSEQLFKAITALHKNGPKKTTKHKSSYNLPPLYKN